MIAGAGGIPFATISVASADESNYYLGDVRFVETKIEYPNPSGTNLTRTLNLAPYCLDRAHDRVTLTSAPVGVFESNDAVVTGGRNFSGLPARLQLQATDSYLPVDVDFRRRTNGITSLSSPMEAPVATVEESGKKVSVAVDGTDVEVPPRETKTLELEPRTVEYTSLAGDTLSETVTPRATIRNNGYLEAFGAAEYKVIPIGSDDTYARDRVNALKAAKKRTESHGIVLEEDDDMVLIPRRVS